VAEEEARGGRSGEDGGRPARKLCRGGGSHGRLGLRRIESHHTEPPHGGATARRCHRTESLGGARAQWGEVRTVMDLRWRVIASAGSEQEKRGGGS